MFRSTFNFGCDIDVGRAVLVGDMPQWRPCDIFIKNNFIYFKHNRLKLNVHIITKSVAQGHSALSARQMSQEVAPIVPVPVPVPLSAVP